MNLAANVARDAYWVVTFRRPAAWDELRVSTALPINATEISATMARGNHRPPASRRMIFMVAAPPTGDFGSRLANLTVFGGAYPRSQMVPSGGIRTIADAGSPCHGSSVASTAPKLPTPLPP